MILSAEQRQKRWANVICLNCKKAFTPTGTRGPRPKYCSNKCWLLSNHKVPERKYVKTCFHCKQKYKAFKRNKFCSIKCANRCTGDKNRQRVICKCKNCGKEYLPKGIERLSFCSRDCSFKFHRGINHQSHTTFVKSTLLNLNYNSCATCGALVTMKSKRTRTCTDLCQKKYEREHYNVPKKVLRKRTCRYCEQQFVPEYGNKRRKFCSSKCSRKFNQKTKASTHIQRARKFGGQVKYFNVRQVFVRDKWRCQLCGISTPKQLKGKNRNNSPELDHIIPLSKGGDHVWSNVQCACRRCNLAKSSRILGQLWLNDEFAKSEDQSDARGYQFFSAAGI